MGEFICTVLRCSDSLFEISILECTIYCLLFKNNFNLHFHDFKLFVFFIDTSSCFIYAYLYIFSNSIFSYYFTSSLQESSVLWVMQIQTWICASNWAASLQWQWPYFRLSGEASGELDPQYWLWCIRHFPSTYAALYIQQTLCGTLLGSVCMTGIGISISLTSLVTSLPFVYVSSSNMQDIFMSLQLYLFFKPLLIFFPHYSLM